MKALNTFIALLFIGNVFCQKINLEQLKIQFQELPLNAQISIASIENGIVTYYGFTNLGNGITAIENQHALFEIGSITKVFTSTLMAALELENKINSSTTIDKLLKVKLQHKPRISLLQLSNHTSGLPRLPYNLVNASFNPTNPYQNYREADLNENLKNHLTLINSPGEQSNYSNLGAAILGHALAKSQDDTFENLLEKYVLQPLNLNSTFVYSKNQRDKIVKSYDEKGNIISLWDWDVLAGAGSMISTVFDLSQFALTSLDKQVDFLELTHKPTFEINENMKIARAWHISKAKSGKEYVWHNGATGGYSSFISMNKSDKTAVIILSNIAPTSPYSDIFNNFTFELLEQ